MPVKVTEKPAPSGHGKPKAGTKRKDAGKKIIVRIDDEQHKRLVETVGNVSVSDYVRSKLFGGRPETGERSRDVYRKVAALHLAGRQIMEARAHPNMPADEIDRLLQNIRTAIAQLAADTV